MEWGKALLLLCLSAAFTSAQIQSQNDLDELAAGLKVTWTVVTNTKEELSYQAELTLENFASSVNLSYDSWVLYFDSIFLIEPDVLVGKTREVELQGQGVKVTHVQGSQFTIVPTPEFITIPPGGMRKIKMKIKYWSVARTDVMPNWYLVYPGFTPVVIASTQGEALSFVTAATTVPQWKRYNYDYYNPYTAQDRYERNYIPHSTYDSEIRVIPKPAKVTMDDPSEVTMMTVDSSWYVGFTGAELRFAADYLQDKLSLPQNQVVPNNRPGAKVFNLQTGDVDLTGVNGVIMDSPDAYQVTVDVNTQRVTVTGKTNSGVLYGVITVLSLMDSDGQIPECTIVDAPRFEYRGLMLDISRSFHPKDEILEIISLMASYKLNKLHLHLTDDEGWRIEIPALPELTKLGSKRCHDPDETKCLLPQIGSGPDSSTAYSSGFLSSDDYKEILSYANDRHVTVIPEIDMPGHARAAIKSMELRGDPQTELSEPGDPSIYTTPQMFSDNAINPCQNSTYSFISIVMDELISLHKAAQQPLTEFHFGGDEVGSGAWVNSTRCKALKDAGVLPGDSPKWYFFQRVSELAAMKGVSLGAWEDGLMRNGTHTFDLDSVAIQDVTAYNWDNVWEWGTMARTYTFANNGYKVVMAHGTNMYFDHPYEPDPEERGYYWATRFTDTMKTFTYNAVRYYDNFHVRRSGEPVTEAELCGENNASCVELTARENIIGMEATLFSETTRTREHLHDRLFPRLLAMAERAWHQAEWEDLDKGEERDAMMKEDWYSFARAIGHRELKRLDQSGVLYRIPPPGAVISHGRLLTTGLFPGLQVQYSVDAGATWMDAEPNVFIDDYKYRIWLRTRNTDGSRYSRIIVLHQPPPIAVVNQPIIDYIAENMHVQYTVVDNYKKYGDVYYEAKLELRNLGGETIPGGNWKIYFTSVQVVEPEYIKSGRVYIDHISRIELAHVKGYLYSLGPTTDFMGLDSEETLEFTFRVDYWSVSRYEQMPRWYVSAPGMNARNLVLTDDESLDFVSPFTKVEQWKRTANDQFDPWTPGARYDRNAAWEVTPVANPPVIPTPVSYNTEGNKHVDLTQGSWTLVYGEASLMGVAQYFKDTVIKFLPNVNAELANTAPSEMYIRFQLGKVEAETDSTEAYNVKVDAEAKKVEVVASTDAGAFYGAVTLVQMAVKGSRGAIPNCEVTDYPRFPYRGMHVDTARNFQPKETILKLLDVMALYKLNKLHFHLTDDEGWRLEIPGLEELTQLGSRRCHDLDETECIMSTMGSGADDTTSGTGYYSVADYHEILQYANDRHIEVIPEFDSPGHAHAAIRSLRYREKRMAHLGDTTAAAHYRLDDPQDTSHYFSVQYYTDNAINPCVESTFKFFEKLFTEVRKLHENIQPLKVFHFGGDEVARGAWVNSTACVDLIKSGANLKELFTRRISEITKDVTLGAWEDGLMGEDPRFPWERSLLPNKEIIAQAWQNVWEWEVGSRAYNLANAGYKVVFSPVTHTYFDHPQEPSPEERGFYWGTRYTDAYKTFSFMPDDFYLNIDIRRSGEPITMEEVCAQKNNTGCPPLEKPENVIGLQGQLWAETVRLPEQFDYMVYPRLLALAERAWHKASWEGQPKAQRIKGLTADWARFAESLGANDLAMLDTLGVAYRVPPPGARQVKDKYTISTNVEFPGLKVQSTLAGSNNWVDHSPTKTFNAGQKISIRTVSADGTRYSSEVQVTMVKQSDGNGANYIQGSFLCVIMVFVSYYFTSILI